MEEMAKKRVKDSETEQSYLLMHRHINGYGRLFGGQLVEWIDELAGLVGRRHCGHEITTACIDNLNFKHPAFLNDTVVLVGRVTYVGRTSMEVRVDTYVEELATRHSENDQPCLRGDGGHRRERPRTSRPGPDSGIPGAGGRVGGRKTPV